MWYIERKRIKKGVLFNKLPYTSNTYTCINRHGIMLSRISTLYCKVFPLYITWPSVGFGESSLAISDNNVRGFFIYRRCKSQDKQNSAFSKQLRFPSITG